MQTKNEDTILKLLQDNPDHTLVYWFGANPKPMFSEDVSHLFSNLGDNVKVMLIKKTDLKTVISENFKHPSIHDIS